MTGDYLFEILCEEIPAAFQLETADTLANLFKNLLDGNAILYGDLVCHVTPRRFCLIIEGVSLCGQDVAWSKKGPKLTAPQKAIDGFMRANAISSLSEMRVVEDSKKGDFYEFGGIKKGVSFRSCLVAGIPILLEKFPWKTRTMRWGNGKAVWLRPIERFASLLQCGEKLEVVEFDWHGIVCSSQTRGHRVYSPQLMEITSVCGYEDFLRQHKVVLSSSERMAIIEEQLQELLSASDSSGSGDNDLLPEDYLPDKEELIAENAGLVEWPKVYLGTIDSAYLFLPQELITLTLKTNQKYFTVYRDYSEIRPEFLFVSNLDNQNPKSIIDGNNYVVNARLADAKYFFEKDLQVDLLEHAGKLATTRYYDNLGSQLDRCKRIASLMAKICDHLGLVLPLEAEKLAFLTKADLATQTVIEFPELQGTIGKYLAKSNGYDREVYRVIEEHYQPKTAKDDLGFGDISVLAALSDKLETLVSFCSIGFQPKGSRDPFALRRAAMGIVRLSEKLSIDLGALIDFALSELATFSYISKVAADEELRRVLVDILRDRLINFLINSASVARKVLGGSGDSEDLRYEGSEHEYFGGKMMNYRHILAHHLVGKAEHNNFAFTIALYAKLLSLDSESLAKLVAYKRVFKFIKFADKLGKGDSFVGLDNQRLLVLLNQVKAGQDFDISAEEQNLIVALEALFDKSNLLDNCRIIDELVTVDAIEKGIDTVVSGLVSQAHVVDEFFDSCEIMVADLAIRQFRIKLVRTMANLSYRLCDFSLLV